MWSKSLYRAHVKHQFFLSCFSETWISSTGFREKYSIIKFHDNPSSVSELFHVDRRSSERNDVEKLIVAFRNFANARKHCFEIACPILFSRLHILCVTSFALWSYDFLLNYNPFLRSVSCDRIISRGMWRPLSIDLYLCDVCLSVAHVKFIGFVRGTSRTSERDKQRVTFVCDPTKKTSSSFFNLQAPCVLYIGQAFRCFPENAFYIFNQQIYFIIWYLLDLASLI